MPPVARRARLVAALRVTAVMSGATWPPAKADQRAARAGMGPRPPASGRAGARALRAARTPAHRPAARPPPQAGAPLKTKSTAKSTAKSKPAWQEGGCATPACSRKCASRKISPDRSFAFVSCSQLPDAARKNAHRYDELASGPTYYNYFRDYDPAIGRYSQSDPIGLKGGTNTYGYVKQDPIRRQDPSGLEDPTFSDYFTCLSNWGDCQAMRRCADDAKAETLRRFGRQGHNDRSDAFRHCFWSCCMTQKMGASQAQKFGDSHENYPDNPICEKNMDLFNNAVGRGLGAGNPRGDCGAMCSGANMQVAPQGSCAPCGTRDYFKTY